VIIDNNILDLYQCPDLLDVYVSNLSDTKKDTNVFTQFELQSKIKIMRLLNNEIKMVYNQNSDGDFNEGLNSGFDD
jgi:hypothetical protein